MYVHTDTAVNMLQVVKPHREKNVSSIAWKVVVLFVLLPCNLR